MKNDNKPILVSACLAGLCTRYDAQIKHYPKLRETLKSSPWLPVCPEQLGGLPTPREAADIIGGDGRDVLSGTAKVLTKSGADLTAAFIKGAEQVLEIAQRQGVKTAYLKARSPSCAVHGVIGVTAALLEDNNIKICEM